MTWRPDQMRDLSGVSSVVTGANSGIGWWTARELAAHHARVILACRDVERGKQAADRIRSAVPYADVEVAELDLSSIASVRSFADAWVGPLDLLINNAGVMAPPKRKITVDGFELQFGTNHLGHFVLTGLLLPTLLRAENPRVVTVSSTAHHTGKSDVIGGNLDGRYNPQHTYGNSKLANLLFTHELQSQADARNLPLVATAAHPGVAATGLVADKQGMGASRLMRVVAPVFLKVFTQSPAAGARATLFAATEGEPGSFTGPQRMAESRGPIGPANLSAEAKDEKLGRRLWHVSEEVTGFRYTW